MTSDVLPPDVCVGEGDRGQGQGDKRADMDIFAKRKHYSVSEICIS